MKVLHVNDVAGVASNYVAGLREIGVAADLYQPTIGTYWFGGTWKTRLLLPYTRTAEAFRLRQTVRREGYDVLHIHYAALAFLALAPGLPFSLHIHGKDIRDDVRKPGLGQLTRAALRKAKRVYCATPDLVDRARVFRPDAVYIPNPIDFSSFHPQPRDSSGLPKMLCISKLDRYKGYDVIQASLERVWACYPDLKVGMFSFGNNTAEIWPFIEKHRQSIELLDRVPHERMSDLINAYDIVLGQHSDIASILTLSELEAMACEKPVVVNFQYNRFYPEPPAVRVSTNADEAFSHLRQLIESVEERRSLGAAARQWALKYHDRKQSAAALMDWYRQDDRGQA